MRSESAASLKYRQYKLQAKPREGTKIRQIYDALMNNKGKLVDLSLFGPRPDLHVESLRTFYGLDIRHSQQVLKKRIKGHYILVGEWIGPAYLDYIIS